ncbi:MAG: hypothetical protein JWM81_465 [Candidatus Saccharibacteria bacterium]|nr:hypothetical protein [Candidatus Saccharibacteria bacterium]
MVGLIFLVGIGVILGRGIWRSNILPAYTDFQHKSDLEATHTAAARTVNEALKPLGLNVGNRKSVATCSLDIANVWRTSIYCSSADSQGVPRTISPLPSATDPLVKQVQASMERDGWQGGWDVPIWQLISFNKSANGFNCVLQLWIDTYQTVTPRLFCSQTYHYLGDPYK